MRTELAQSEQETDALVRKHRGCSIMQDEQVKLDRQRKWVKGVLITIAALLILFILWQTLTPFIISQFPTRTSGP